MRIHIATGSNLGDRQKHLDDADRRMAASLGVVLRTSPTYRTQAVGMALGTPDFLNRIIELELHAHCGDQPEQVMATLLAIEQEMGRQRPKEGYTSRPIDLDIVLWGNRVLQLDNLQVPHPRMLQRRFVLRPLADLIPEQPIPSDGRTVAQCLTDLPEDVPQIAPWP